MLLLLAAVTPVGLTPDIIEYTVATPLQESFAAAPMGAALAGFILALVVVAFAGYRVFIVVRARIRRKKFARLDRGAISVEWKRIKEKSTSGSDGSAFALIEADVLFDETTGILFTPQLPFAKRLGMLVTQYPDVEGVWYAHRVRNRVAHKRGAGEASGQAVKKALRYYEQALKHLGLF